MTRGAYADVAGVDRVISPFGVGKLSMLSLLLCELWSFGLLLLREGTGLPLLLPLVARRSVADLLVFCEERVVGGDDLSSNHELSVDVDLLRCLIGSRPLPLPSLLEFSDDGPLSVAGLSDLDRRRRLRSFKNAGITLRSE